MTHAALLPPSLRDDFPLLGRQGPTGRPLVYFDSAATSLKPRSVIDAVVRVMEQHTANIHRSVHVLGDEATALYEAARHQVARLIGAEDHEVVFLRNTTEALNLIARWYPRKGRVLVSLGEHHSNLLCWGDHEVKRLAPLADGRPDETAFFRELSKGGVAALTVSHISNVTGIRVDARRLADAAHAARAIFILDAAQSVPHSLVNVQELDCDFLAFSGHKMCGPSGVGVLYGKAERLAELNWHNRGGGTVEHIERGFPISKPSPWRFEAGTPAIEAVVGVGAAATYLQHIGLEGIEAHNRALRLLALKRLREVPGIAILGPRDEASSGPLSFTVAGTSAHVIARSLSDSDGICIRSGYHCAQPLHDQLNSLPSARLSFYLYNQASEIDLFFDALAGILRVSCIGG
jgi:cysteine desulfurase / selenocysteine lyase